MKSPSSIGRRIISAFSAFQQRDYEGACIHLFPAIDKTAKRRRPKEGVGERIRQFIADQEAIISVVATGNYMVRNYVDGIGFPDAIDVGALLAIANIPFGLAAKFWHDSAFFPRCFMQRTQFALPGQNAACPGR